MNDAKQIATKVSLGPKEAVKQEIVQKVFAILRENHLTRNEIQVLFGADKHSGAGKNIDCAAERIISLFILEKLTIEEGKDVLKEVTNSLPREKDFSAVEN